MGDKDCKNCNSIDKQLEILRHKKEELVQKMKQQDDLILEQSDNLGQKDMQLMDMRDQLDDFADQLGT